MSEPLAQKYESPAMTEPLAMTEVVALGTKAVGFEGEPLRMMELNAVAAELPEAQSETLIPEAWAIVECLTGSQSTNPLSWLVVSPPLRPQPFVQHGGLA